jgi:hypothetical protein
VVSDAVDRFIADLRADPRFAASADSIKACIVALDYEAGSPLPSAADAAGLFEAVYWVVGRPDRSLSEKLDKIHDLVTRKGRQSGTIREIVGWR